MLIIDNILVAMLLKHMKGFYSIKKSNKILSEAQRILCSLILGDDLCPREITVADGRLELGSLKKDFLLGGQLQSSLCVCECMMERECACVCNCLRACRLMVKLLCSRILQRLSLF